MVRIFGSLLPAAAAICLTASAAVTVASSLTFNSAKFSLTTLDGSSRLSDSFTPASPAIKSLSEGVTLAADEIIRMSFTVPTTGSGASVSDESSEDSESPSSVKKSVGLPEQILLQLVQPREGKVAAIVPTVNQESGKVTFSQRIDRLPVASLAARDPTYTLRLLLGSSGSAKPLSLDLGTVTIPSLSQRDGATPSIAIGSSSEREKKAREMGFYPWEEKRHTFRKEVTEGMPGEKKSLIVMAVIVIVPWLVLIGLVSGRIERRKTSSFTDLFPFL